MRRKAFILLFMMMTFFPHPASASMKEDVKNGNVLYNKKKFADARKVYQDAVSKNPGSGIASFNLGDSLYREGNYSSAVTNFNNAIATGKDKFVQASDYNIGNVYYRMAGSLQVGEVAKAKEKLETSVKFYKRAIDLDPKDKDAKFNYEFVRNRLNQLVENKDQKQEQKKQDKQQQDKKQQDKKKENQDKNQDKKEQEKNDSNQDKDNKDQEQNKSQGNTPQGGGGSGESKDKDNKDKEENKNKSQGGQGDEPKKAESGGNESKDQKPSKGKDQEEQKNGKQEEAKQDEEDKRDQQKPQQAGQNKEEQQDAAKEGQKNQPAQEKESAGEKDKGGLESYKSPGSEGEAREMSEQEAKMMLEGYRGEEATGRTVRMRKKTVDLPEPARDW